jgi:rod shape-determining protein MreC
VYYKWQENKDKKRHILVLGIFFLLCSLITTAYSRTHRGFLRNLSPIVTTFEAPLLHVVSLLRSSVLNITSSHYFFATEDVKRLEAENNFLKKRIATLRYKLIFLQDAEQENAFLKKLLRLKKSHKLNGKLASIIGYDLATVNQGITIDIGYNDRIELSQAVVGPKGLIGQVSFVGPSYAKVMLISDVRSAVEVISSKTGIRGILKGLSSGGAEVQFMDSDRLVGVKERLLTTGSDRIFPKGMLVGTVTKVINQNTGLFVKANVDLAERPNSYSYLYVVKHSKSID